MLNLTLERIERQIRYLPVEHVYVLGPDNEILFHHTDDRPNRVTLPLRVLSTLDIAVVTHNHPGGRSFSRQDVVMARAAELKELRVVTARQRFSLQPPAEGWGGVDPNELDRVVAREESLLMARLLNEIQKGALTTDLVVYHHRLWEQIARLGLIRYAVEQW